MDPPEQTGRLAAQPRRQTANGSPGDNGRRTRRLRRRPLQTPPTGLTKAEPQLGRQELPAMSLCRAYRMS